MRRGVPREPDQESRRSSSASDGGAREHSVEPIAPAFAPFFDQQIRDAGEHYRRGGREAFHGSIDSKEVLG